MKVLICGGTGYIGNTVCNQFLNKGNVVANIGRNKHPNKDVSSFDINENFENVIDDFLPDVIIYLAASFDNSDPEEVIQVNITIPLQLMVANSEHKAKFIYIGSYWEFGSSNNEGIPIDLYSASKKSFCNFLDYFKTYCQFKCIHIVLYGTYGENDGRGKLLDYIIKQAVNNQKIRMTPGEQLLNLCAVHDVAKELYKICIDETEDADEILICSEKEYSPKDLINIIKKQMDVEVDFGAIRYRKVELMKPIYPKSYKNIVLKDKIEDYINHHLSLKDI